MQNMYGKDFPGLSQRLIYSYLIPMAEFVYYPNCGIGEESQRQFKTFLHKMLETLYNDISIIDLPEFEDTYSWKEDGKVFSAKTQKIKQKFDRFTDFLIKIGRDSEIDSDGFKLEKAALKSKARRTQLEAIGFEIEDMGGQYHVTHSDYPQMFAAYKCQAERPADNQIQPRLRFLLGMMEDRTLTAVETWAAGMPSAAFTEFMDKMEQYCASNGYTLVNSEWGPNLSWQKGYPKKKVLQFTAYAMPWHQYQVKYNVRASDFKSVLEETGSMSDGLKAMIINRANTCHGCRYCVQTDKTGEKPLAFTKIEHNGEKKTICTYFPFWDVHEPDGSNAAAWIELMTLADRVLTEKYGKKK